MDSTFEQARRFFLEGVADYGAGRLAAAERKFAAALDLMPGRPSVLTNLGAVRLKLGRPAEAIALLEEALAQEPANAEALGHCGTAYAEIGRPQKALELFDRALAQEPGLGLVWTMRGSVLKELGRNEEAAQSFRRALENGADADLNHFYLAGLREQQAPAHAPPGYVRALFDGYADQFDSHLVHALRYDAPSVLARRLAATGRRYAHALDLGCGTGLCGPYLRRMADQVTGVDLSAAMLDKAQALIVYDTLLQAEVLAFLKATDERFDLVIAADVFIYVGALDEVFAQLARIMPPQGSFCFTVESSADEEVVLRPTLRYAHSEAGLRRLAQAHGFRVLTLEQRPVREEQRVPIPGLFAWLEKA